MSVVSGIGIEVGEMKVVGALLGLLVPAYLWVSRAKDQRAMIERGAVAGSAVLVATLAYGLSKR